MLCHAVLAGYEVQYGGERMTAGPDRCNWRVVRRAVPHTDEESALPKNPLTKVRK